MFQWQASTIRRSPKLVLAALGAVTLALLAGAAVQDPPDGPIDSTGIFLPDDSQLAEATDTIRESFPASADLRVVQMLVKGDVLSADSLRSVHSLQTAIAGDPLVQPFLATEPLAGYVDIVGSLAAAAGLDLDTISDSQLAAGLAQMARSPQFAEVNDLLGRFLARNDAGDPIAGLSLIILDDIGDALGQEQAQFRAHEIADSIDFAPLDVSIISLANSDAEGKEARERSLVTLTAIALAVIFVLLAVFYRTQSDVYITMAGLLMTILWTLGAQAWLSPGGAGIVDPANLLLTLVPVLLISLCVDYGLQITGRYREALRDDEGSGARPAENIPAKDAPKENGLEEDIQAEDAPRENGAQEDGPGRAVTRSVMLCGVPVLLAAGTTAVSLLANLTSRFEPVAEFGIMASIGVISGWIVMTNFVPAARLALDRRRAAKRRTLAARPLADTIPGTAAILPRVAAAVVRRPAAVLAAAAVVTVLAVLAATDLSTTFAAKDFLPEDSETTKNFNFLEDNFNGSASLMTVLIEADLDSARAVGDLADLHAILTNADRRPAGVIASPLASAGTLLADWTTGTGQAGDRYAPEIAAAFGGLGDGAAASDEDVRRAWLLLEDADPAGFAEVLDLRSDGLDRTIIQIPVAVRSIEELRTLIAEIEALWPGDGTGITVTGGDALVALITEELADSQLVSVSLVIAAALTILMLYFGFSERRPVLGLLTILPIAATLAWLLGTMWVLGISYNMSTALMVVLTIGIGVDYTIHMTHRFLEEEREARRVVDAVRQAMLTTGGALLASALTTALGLLALVFSPLVPMQELGILAAVAIVLGLVATFTVLPPLLVLWARYHRWRSPAAAPEGAAEAAV